MYYVYVHTVPNGKMYIGQTKDIEKRWNNGEGYSEIRPFYKDISVYGWNSIKHEIVAEFSDREPALRLEAVLIALMNTENETYGYNQTSIYKDAIKAFTARVPAKGISLESPAADDSFFEQFNLPVDACKELIDQWIFNKEYRDILKSRLIDGLSYPQLSEMYGKSIRRLKDIVYTSCQKLEKRL